MDVNKPHPDRVGLGASEPHDCETRATRPNVSSDRQMVESVCKRSGSMCAMARLTLDGVRAVVPSVAGLFIVAALAGACTSGGTPSPNWGRSDGLRGVPVSSLFARSRRALPRLARLGRSVARSPPSGDGGVVAVSGHERATSGRGARCGCRCSPRRVLGATGACIRFCLVGDHGRLSVRHAGRCTTTGRSVGARDRDRV